MIHQPDVEPMPYKSFEFIEKETLVYAFMLEKSPFLFNSDSVLV